VGNIPATSITLLKEISSSADSVRWTEFYQRYEETMRGFLHERFPSVEADDVIQDTMLALMKTLPEYRYSPDSKGHFRNYLIGIVKNKALHALEKSQRIAATQAELATSTPADRSMEDDEEARWRTAVMEAAVEQLMSDASIPVRNREIFRCVALEHEAPAKVAERFGVSRGNVDVIKSRIIDRLSSLVRRMSSV